MLQVAVRLVIWPETEAGSEIQEPGGGGMRSWIAQSNGHNCRKLAMVHASLLSHTTLPDTYRGGGGLRLGTIS